MAYKVIRSLNWTCEGKHELTGASPSAPFVAVVDSKTVAADPDDPYQYALDTADTQYIIFPIAGFQWVDAYHYCDTAPTTPPKVKAFGYFPYPLGVNRFAPSDANSNFDAPTEATQFTQGSPNQTLDAPGVWLPLFDSNGNHELTLDTLRVNKDSTAGGATGFSILSANNNWYTKGARWGMLLVSQAAATGINHGCILAHLTT